MAKMILIDHEKCVGCQMCEMICSLSHGGEVNPFRSRIAVVKCEEKSLAIPINCRQCNEAPCEAVCPVKAISRDLQLARQVVNYDKCIGCCMCIVICPFGAISFDSSAKKVVKCDLCDGDPLCVKFCAYGALRYVDDEDLNSPKQIKAAERILEASHNAETAIKCIV